MEVLQAMSPTLRVACFVHGQCLVKDIAKAATTISVREVPHYKRNTVVQLDERSIKIEDVILCKKIWIAELVWCAKHN
ncbi:hypothetical protein [Novilysobacter erysipheiresistens]